MDRAIPVTAPVVFTNSRQPWHLSETPHDGDRHTKDGFYAVGQLWGRVAEGHTEQGEA
jgi:hypothetical protein